MFAVIIPLIPQLILTISNSEVGGNPSYYQHHTIKQIVYSNIIEIILLWL